MDGRPTLLDYTGQHQAIQRSRHSDISENRVNVAPALQNPDRRIGMAGFKNCITGIVQQRGGRQTNKRLVLNDENNNLFQWFGPWIVRASLMRGSRNIRV